MRRLFLLTLLLLLLIPASRAAEITLSGHYYGNNLYVNNPGSDGDFCVTAVTVNGQPSLDEIRSNAFEIDFGLMGIKNGEAVTVVITHREGCTPEIMNPWVIKADQNFSYTYIKLDRGNKITWDVSGDIGTAPFYVEQYRWNRWVRVDEVDVNDTLASGGYEAELPFHTGPNQFRVMRMDAFGNPVYSKTAKYNNTRQQPVELKSLKVTTTIIFSAETMYELYDASGKLLSSGTATSVDVSSLEKGKYFLNFDAQTACISKK